MRIAELTDRWKGRDVYVVGTGPSLRVFPVGFLRDKATIGLNAAWKYFRGGPGPALSVTVHPEHVVEYEQDAAPDRPATVWLTKAKPPLADLAPDDARYYVFDTAQDDWSAFAARPADKLFCGRGVQQTAMDLAARTGAAAVYLVGVDMTDLGGDHHGHDQHVRFHGLAPADVYAEYRKYTAKARSELARLGVPVFSLSALLGEVHGNEDYQRLISERGLAPLPAPPDTSRYVRVPDGTNRPVKGPPVAGQPRVQRYPRRRYGV